MTFPDVIREDVEVVLRRVEVRKLWESDWEEEDLQIMARVSLEFMRKSIEVVDARFLNAALKLNDRLRKDWEDRKELSEIENAEQTAWKALRARLGLTP